MTDKGFRPRTDMEKETDDEFPFRDEYEVLDMIPCQPCSSSSDSSGSSSSLDATPPKVLDGGTQESISSGNESAATSEEIDEGGAVKRKSDSDYTQVKKLKVPDVSNRVVSIEPPADNSKPYAGEPPDADDEYHMDSEYDDASLLITSNDFPIVAGEPSDAEKEPARFKWCSGRQTIINDDKAKKLFSDIALVPVEVDENEPI